MKNTLPSKDLCAGERIYKTGKTNLASFGSQFHRQVFGYKTSLALQPASTLTNCYVRTKSQLWLPRGGTAQRAGGSIAQN